MPVTFVALVRINQNGVGIASDPPASGSGLIETDAKARNDPLGKREVGCAARQSIYSALQTSSTEHSAHMSDRKHASPGVWLLILPSVLPG